MMKKFFLASLAIILLGSCASKFGIQKRRYNKGFYFASTKGHKTNADQKELISQHSGNLELRKTASLPVTNTLHPELLISQNVHQISNVSQNASHRNESKKIHSNSVVASAQNNPIVKKHEIKTFDLSNFKYSSDAKKTSDTDLIIQVILCFLWWFNLLAVFLHDGQKFTLNFWITLLLDFTFIGGVIFALLVVLDVVDLNK